MGVISVGASLGVRDTPAPAPSHTGDRTSTNKRKAPAPRTTSNGKQKKKQKSADRNVEKSSKAPSRPSNASPASFKIETLAIPTGINVKKVISSIISIHGKRIKTVREVSGCHIELYSPEAYQSKFSGSIISGNIVRFVISYPSEPQLRYAIRLCRDLMKKVEDNYYRGESFDMERENRNHTRFQDANPTPKPVSKEKKVDLTSSDMNESTTSSKKKKSKSEKQPKSEKLDQKEKPAKGEKLPKPERLSMREACTSLQSYHTLQKKVKHARAKRCHQIRKLRRRASRLRQQGRTQMHAQKVSSRTTYLLAATLANNSLSSKMKRAASRDIHLADEASSRSMRTPSSVHRKLKSFLLPLEKQRQPFYICRKLTEVVRTFRQELCKDDRREKRVSTSAVRKEEDLSMNKISACTTNPIVRLVENERYFFYLQPAPDRYTQQTVLDDLPTLLSASDEQTLVDLIVSKGHVAMDSATYLSQHFTRDPNILLSPKQPIWTYLMQHIGQVHHIALAAFFLGRHTVSILPNVHQDRPDVRLFPKEALDDPNLLALLTQPIRKSGEKGVKAVDNIALDHVQGTLDVNPEIVTQALVWTSITDVPSSVRRDMISPPPLLISYLVELHTQLHELAGALSDIQYVIQRPLDTNVTQTFAVKEHYSSLYTCLEQVSKSVRDILASASRVEVHRLAQMLDQTPDKVWTSSVASDVMTYTCLQDALAVYADIRVPYVCGEHDNDVKLKEWEHLHALAPPVDETPAPVEEEMTDEAMAERTKEEWARVSDMLDDLQVQLRTESVDAERVRQSVNYLCRAIMLGISKCPSDIEKNVLLGLQSQALDIQRQANHILAQEQAREQETEPSTPQPREEERKMSGQGETPIVIDLTDEPVTVKKEPGRPKFVPRPPQRPRESSTGTAFTTPADSEAGAFTFVNETNYEDSPHRRNEQEEILRQARQRMRMQQQMMRGSALRQCLDGPELWDSSRIQEMWQRRDLYGVLGAPKDASTMTLKSQYRKLALRLHPDKTKETNGAKVVAAFVSVTKAYKLLTGEQ